MRPWSIAVLAWSLVPSTAIGAGFDATVQFARRVEIGLPVSGVVTAVNVEAGARAKQGDVLVALDVTPFQAAVERAQGGVARASADYDEATRDFKHMKEIYDRQLASTTELDNTRLKIKRADGALMEARAALKRAQYNLARSRILAPFDATILAVQAQPGQSVVAALESRPVVVLAAHGEFLAITQVPGAELDKRQLGQAVSVTVAGKRYPGTIKSIAREALAGQAGKDPLYQVGVTFSATDAVLRGGQTARVEFP